MLGSVGGHKVEVFRCIDFNYTQMGHGVSPHTYASNLAIKAMLAQNPIEKRDQPIAYASKLVNNVKENYTTIERETFAMVYVLHNFKHYLL